MLDISMGERAKWLADEQWAGRGKVVLCAACGSSGFDPDDPSDHCPVCRGVGAALRADLRPDTPAPSVTVTEAAPEPTLMRWMRAFLG